MFISTVHIGKVMKPSCVYNTIKEDWPKERWYALIMEFSSAAEKKVTVLGRTRMAIEDDHIK